MTDARISRIKPCRNCGWSATLYHEKGFGWCVQCENCGRITDEYYDNPADAIKEWNRWVGSEVAE